MEIFHVRKRQNFLILGAAFFLFMLTWRADCSHLSGEQAIARRAMPSGEKQDVPNFQTDPEVQEAAKFAVQEYSRQRKMAHALVLWKVVSAQYQVVAGTMYYLTLLAGSGKYSDGYEAKIWVKPWQHNSMSLEDFKLISS